MVGGVFRALVTLQGTLALLDPEFHLVDEARALGAEWMQESFGLTSLRKAATDELLALLPLLQRLRHAARLCQSRLPNSDSGS